MEEQIPRIDERVGRVLETRLDVENLIIEHAYKLKNVPDITLQNIKELDRPRLVAGLIEKSKTEWEPTIEELMALTCVLVRDKASAWKDRVEYTSGTYDENSLPWPQEVLDKVSPVPKKIWKDFVATDEDDDGPRGDGLEYAVRKVLWNTSNETKSKYAEYIFSNLKNFSQSYYPSIISELTFLATETLEGTDPSSISAGVKMLEFARQNIDYISLPSYFDDENREYLEKTDTSSGARIDIYNTSTITNGQFGGEIGRNITGLFGGNGELMLRSIAQLPEEERPLYVGEIIRFHGLSRTLNMLRSLYFNQALESEKGAIESVMRPFWRDVVGDGDFQPNLLAFYDTYGYVEYPLTTPETELRKVMLKEKLPELGIEKGAKIAEVACGTGLLTNALSDEYETVGVDINPTHIKIAKERYPESTFVVGDWYNLLNITEIKGAEVVVIDGRSLPHVDELDNLYKVFNQCARLKVKAIIYTFPDPNTGVLKERREKLLDVMVKFKFNKDWLKNHFYNAVGRLGNNLGNRWLPPQDLLEEATEVSGFKVQEVIREENYDGNGTDNLVFICPFVQNKYERDNLRDDARERLRLRGQSQELYPNPNKAWNHYSAPVHLFGAIG